MQIHNFREMQRMEKFYIILGFFKEMIESFVIKKETLKFSGRINSERHIRNLDIFV